MNSPERIQFAALVSARHVVIGSGVHFGLLDLEQTTIVHACQEEDLDASSAASSPDGTRVILGNRGGNAFLWSLADHVMIELADGTLNANAAGWANNDTIVLAAPYGGVVRGDLESYLAVDPDQRRSTGLLGPGFAALKFQCGQLIEDEEVAEHRMNDTHASCFYRDAQGCHVVELLDGDRLNHYDIDDRQLRHSSTFQLSGRSMVHSNLRLCGERLVQLEGDFIKVMQRSDGAVQNEFKVPAGSQLVSDIDYRQVFINNDGALSRLNLATGERAEIINLKSPRSISVVGNRLLSHYKNSLHVIDIDSGGIVSRLAFVKKNGDLTCVTASS